MPLHRRLIGPPVTLGLALLVGCGARPGARSGDDRSPPPAAGTPALPAPGGFYGPGLADYAAGAGWTVDPVESQLTLDLGRALTPPPALDCLAREYAARFAADGQDPDPGTVAALARHCGYWTQPAHPYSVTAPDEARLVEHIRTLPPAAFEGTVGLGVARDPKGPLTLTLLRDPGEVRLDGPVARTSASAPIAGHLIRGDGQLELWVDAADGPQRIELEVSDVGRFSGVIPAGATRVELARKQGRFRRTVALFDRSPPAAGYPAPSADRPPSEQTAAQLIERINQIRVSAGRQPLAHESRLDPVLDDWLHRVAERNADDAPPGMLDARGWPYAQLRYAIASGRDAGQIVDLLVDSPTGRQAVLSDEIDHITVGLRPFEKGQGFDAVFAGVQSFRAAAPADARVTLLAGLNAARGQDHHPPLAPSAVLDEVAQRLAEEALAGRVAWDAVVPGLMGAVAEQKLVRGAFAAGAFASDTLEDAPFDQEPSALSPAVTVIGVGVAGGPLPNGGAPRYLVVYVVAEGVAIQEI